MFTKNYSEAFEAFLKKNFSPNKIPIQDKIKEQYNLQSISQNIINKQKKLIDETNKSFFNEFSKLYYQNILLKNRLLKVLDEKKKLNQIIIKYEQEISKSQKEKKIEETNNKDNNENRINIFRKRKRKRRKKSEVISKYKCPFLNCNKSYPSVGSLNMHIKLKHQ